MKTEAMVVDDPGRSRFQVHRSAMTSPDILKLERERVFDRVWLYVGHESEVEHPGDYRRRDVGGRPVLFVRGSDGKVRTLLNSCMHRGAMVCRQDDGNAQSFQCFYHAWTYNNKGELVGVPDEGGYGGGFDKREWSLRSPPRMESYRGFHFISFNPNVEELASYLAGAKEYIDLVVNQAEVGMRIIPGSHRSTIKANWKLAIDNTGDVYHVPPLHQTFFAYAGGISGGKINRPYGTSRNLGNGHAVTESQAAYGRPIARWYPLFGEHAKEEIAAIRARLVEQYGEKQAYRMADTIRLLRIYPNLFLLDITGITVRVFWPTSWDRTEVTAWQLAPREESGERLARRLDNYVSFLGPAGFATPDDIEAMESSQLGFRAREVEWMDYSRGMHLDAGDEGIDKHDLLIRVFWREWRAQLQERVRSARRYRRTAAAGKR